ncbi:cytochrome c [Legionella sp. km772]|uniref:c-type cytochrome n=1 Tax=Legionella sp. km772 TaxID=2498111 RepID=UPI000F8DB340|nr:c-type cytochrome [Legionella sp. km772]RUR12887.1 cytochrome c4 [Legionella sp. km772]
MNKLFFILLLFSTAVFAEDKRILCTACHGPEGISRNPEWPNIAGQNSSYFTKQLKDMKARTTRDPGTMAGIVGALTQQDIDDLAAYYAKMPAAQGITAKQFLQRGQQLYRGGDRSKGIPACIACHGPKGAGNNSAGFPQIAGQHANYTIAQLIAFKEKKRTNDLNHIMQDISARMSQEDIEAVAHYIEGLY